MDLESSMRIAASGMKAQSARLRVTAENLANAESTSRTPGGDPYRRKTISFAERLDRELGVELVEVDRYGVDGSAFPMRYEPGHPAADEKGYVKEPNVNTLVEMMDMREAQRSYEANLNAQQQARAMLQKTLDLLR
ncbi:MAG TPA: flagellar basal body rod protein FlgC [Geminicoccaceae bacterium]|nr:flagellar basal body rod protein FlgC [Geminicoccus sp.]HMU49166.1 flagellar basal body rod protein FlgC [Geminicoccaceae bacterium]